jgi:hypothetical protein
MGSAQDKDAPPPDPGIGHVHGLGVDPADGTVQVRISTTLGGS